MIYLGTLGRMISVGCPSEQQTSPAGRFAFQETLEGRVVGQVRPAGRRSWDLRLPATSTPAETAVLSEFVDGSWGSGPFRFIPTEAPVTNLLPPDVASCASRENPSAVIGDGGPMEQPDGSWSARSYFSPNPLLRMFFGLSDGDGMGPGHAVPVLPGGVVTAAVTLLGEDATLRLRFHDFADDLVASVSSEVVGSDGFPVRAVVTAQVPEGAVSCRVTSTRTVQASRPQVTWTDSPVGWSDGRGCARAVVLGGGIDLLKTGHAAADKTYEGAAFTVQEVG